MDRTMQLVDEIRQLSDQYRKEVSTKRRTWPASIRERVIELKSMGHGTRKVSQLTAIPEPTIWIWTSKRPGAKRKTDTSEFIPITVNSTVKSLTVKSNTHENALPSLGSFAVELPGGLTVRDMDLESLVLLTKRLSQ